MLTPADIMYAKLIVQLGASRQEDVRAEMRSADRDPDSSLDLVSRLVAGGRLEQARVKRIRRYMALFDHVRHEAVYLRKLERRQDLARSVVSDLIARVELSTYRRRIGSLLVESGQLSPDEAVQIERITRKLLRKEDKKVLERYRKTDFEGIARPLVPVRHIDDTVFKVSELFRSKDTMRRVKRAMIRIQSEAPFPAMPGQGAPPTQEFIPPESIEDEEWEEDEEDARQDTARFRKVEAPQASAEALGERQRIGPYQVVECLGQGGMGAVYLSRDEAGTMVAVKVMLAEKAKPEDVARFEREAQICALLKHENTVHLLDRGRTEDGLDYMVIPIYTGKDLADLLKGQGAMHPREAFPIFEQVLEGLEAMHQAKVVHRDLKPENIFVLAGDDRRVRIMDLGIARILDDHLPPAERAFRSRAGIVSGSPAYIAPETITDDPIDARTDIYSLGVMLFEMLTGRLPLFAEVPYDYLREHLVGVPLTLYQGKKDAHWCDELEQLVARMLAKEKEDRPASCQAILDALRGGLRDAAIAHYDDPPQEKDPGQSSLFNSFFKMLRR